MGLDAVIYVPSFIKIGSGVQKLMGGGEYTDTHTQANKQTNTHTHGQQRDLTSLLYFFKIRNVG
jgi:hypothetical protein